MRVYVGIILSYPDTYFRAFSLKFTSLSSTGCLQLPPLKTKQKCRLYRRGGQGKREVGDEGAGEMRGGRREKRGWEEGGEKKRGGRRKRKIIRTQCARRSEKGGGRQGGGRGVRGREGEKTTPCPSPHSDGIASTITRRRDLHVSHDGPIF